MAPFAGVPLKVPDGALTHLYSAGDHPVTEALASGRLLVDVGRSFEDLTEELAPLVGTPSPTRWPCESWAHRTCWCCHRESQDLASHGPDWRPWRSYAESTPDEEGSNIMSVAHSSTVDTPAGPFTAIVAADGAVLASGWTADIALLTPQIHASLTPSSISPRRLTSATSPRPWSPITKVI